MQVSWKQSLAPDILKYAQQRMLRSKRKQQPKKSYLSNPSRISLNLYTFLTHPSIPTAIWHNPF